MHVALNICERNIHLLSIAHGVNVIIGSFLLDTSYLLGSTNLNLVVPSETACSPTASFLPTKAMGDSESLPELLQTLENACNSIDVFPFDSSVLT